ncbi:hypothetical protein VUR80DRAFT_939 [Thermomyces stellatus]
MIADSAVTGSRAGLRSTSTAAPSKRRVSTAYHYVRGDSRRPDLTAPPLTLWIEAHSTLHPRIAGISQWRLARLILQRLSGSHWIDNPAPPFSNTSKVSKIPCPAHKLTGDHPHPMLATRSALQISHVARSEI